MYTATHTGLILAHMDTSFGGLLRVYRRAAGLTQEQLAERAGYSTVYVSMLERGQRLPLPATAMTFADAYGNALDKINGAHTAHRLARNGREVFVIVGDGAIRSHEFLPAVWKASTVTGPP